MRTDILDLATLLKPPDEGTIVRALTAFAASVRHHYGDRLKGLYLFGSRARGDHGPESDVDVAVILADGEWEYWDEKWTLVDLAYDHGVDSGAYIQSWPFAARDWENPGGAHNSRLIATAKRDARPLDDRS